MIQKLLICDSRGYPFYTKVFDKEIPTIDQALLSGLISTIGNIGRQLFKKDIANISFGTGREQSHIFIVNKELLTEAKSIHFVFFMKGECDTKLVKDISTNIFIENKNMLKRSKQFSGQIKMRVDAILDKKYSAVESC